MSRRLAMARGALAGLMIAASFARAGEQVSLGGSLGGGYSWGFADALVSPLATSSGWSLAASLAGSGVLFAPGILRWSADLGYGQQESRFFETRSAADRLGFGVSLQALSGSRFPVALSASRQFGGLTTEGAGLDTVGATMTTTYGASASSNLGNLPALTLSLFHTDTENRLAELSSTRTASTQLGVGVSQSLSRLNYSINYDTAWSGGSFAQQNYEMRNLRVRAAAQVAPGTQLLFDENYLLRTPSVTDPTNPRFDSHSLRTTFQWRPSPEQYSHVGYSYSTVVAGAESLLERTSLLHSASVMHGRRLGAVTLEGDGALDYGLLSVAGAHLGAWGQRVGARALWSGVLAQTDVTSSLTATVGLVEREGEALSGQWGTSASISGSKRWSAIGCGAGYRIGYDRGGVVLPGWQLSQDARFDCSGLVGNEALLRLVLAGAGAARRDRVLGSSIVRDVTLTTELAWRRLRGAVTAGLNDGLPPGLGPAVISDGLFLPAAYTTHRRYVAASASATLEDPRLTVTAVARLGSVELPGSVPRAEVALDLMAQYTLGQIAAALSARHQQVWLGDRWSRNLGVYATLSRSFAFL